MKRKRKEKDVPPAKKSLKSKEDIDSEDDILEDDNKLNTSSKGNINPGEEISEDDISSEHTGEESSNDESSDEEESNSSDEEESESGDNINEGNESDEDEESDEDKDEESEEGEESIEDEESDNENSQENGSYDEDEYEKEKYNDEDLKIFIGRLPKDTDKETVKEFFSKYGNVEWVKFLKFKDTKKFTGAAFLSFSDEQSVIDVLDDAKRNKGKLDFHGKSVNITRADDKPLTKSQKKKELRKKDQFCIYVGNIPWKTQEYEIKKHFKGIGKIASIKIPLLKANKKPRGFAIVEFVNEACVEKAVKLRNGTEIGGRKIKVEAMNSTNKSGK